MKREGLLCPEPCNELSKGYNFRGCLRDRFCLSSEILGFRLGVLDLGRVQVFEGIEKTAKVVV